MSHSIRRRAFLDRAPQIPVPCCCLVLSAVMVMGCEKAESPDSWTYDGRFHKKIARADRIVVRDGGFDCCGPVDDQKVLFEITDPGQISDMREHIEFLKDQGGTVCLCCGYPGIDWYRGKRRLVLTSVQHGHAIRWKGFPCDAVLTKESAEWLQEWLQNHGFEEEQIR